MRTTVRHQYIERDTARVMTEKLYGDRLVNLIWSDEREKGPALFNRLSSSRMSGLLGFFNYDMPLTAKISGVKRFGDQMGMDLSECLDPPETLNTARKIFERKIRYWETRLMPEAPGAIVSPADAKMLAGSFSRSSHLFLKEKFFTFEDLLGRDKPQWRGAFQDGDFAVFRLTPDKYHYNHAPVSGSVLDIYEIPGCCYPCNPGAVMNLATPYSKNKRVVTVVDTDAPNGTQAGLVAMIEIVALMIGKITQCYSDEKYENPRPVTPGMFLRRGQPKSLYQPGSSTDVLIFQKNRIEFSADILANQHRSGIQTRFSEGFGRPLVETEVAVRSEIGRIRKD
jgi:phosphatidylserine decarboxylase